MLTLIAYHHSGPKHRFNTYECSYCHQHVIRRQRAVMHDSCGCHKSEAKVTHGHERGRKKTPELRTWHHLWDRCTNPRCRDWANYGGRGIMVDSRWESFEVFLADMGPRPLGCSIERRDVNGPYSPENCKWATKAEQANNTRSNRRLTVRGKTQTLSAWLLETGFPKTSFYRAVKRGADPQILLEGRLSGGSES